jgi:hypothetical protein
MKIYITMECPECDETMRNGLLTLCEHNGIPEVSWDTASCSTFECEKCEKTYYTGEFEVFDEDEV